MKVYFSAVLLLVASTVPASAITVSSPANGAQLSSPFYLAASTDTCGGVPAVSMGYSIDSNSATIEPASFSTLVLASPGPHVLHVKCWGAQTNDQALLNITISSRPLTSSILVVSPANGGKVLSPFTLTANTTLCSGNPAKSMGYSMDGGSTIAESAPFSVSVSAHLGTHTVLVKCFGASTESQVSLTVDVVPPPEAATPQFSLPSGTYGSTQTVALADGSAGAAIYYTTNGSAPTTSSLRYTGPISVTSSTVIQAIAAGPAYSTSGFARANYTIVHQSQPTVPSNAIAIPYIQTFTGWRIKHDPATGGTADGSMEVVGTPSLSGQTAQYNTDYTSYGGVLYSVTYGNDPEVKNFLYDAEVWIDEGSKIGNLEMDNNQVIANGNTMIYAFQCAGDTNTWDYTENAGTVSTPVVRWVESNQPCNPQNWTPNAWHHVQISTSRDDAGNVTYHSVWLDGVEAPINETVMSEFALGWAPGALVANFQVDGPASGGSSTLYLDDFTISRW